MALSPTVLLSAKELVMPPSKNANLVLNAEQNRRVRLMEAVASLRKGFALDSYHDRCRRWGRGLGN